MSRRLFRQPYRERFACRITDDIDAYFEAFGERHYVFGRLVEIVCDQFELAKRQVKQSISAAEFGVSDSAIHFFARCCDLPARMPSGERIQIDDRYYIINDWLEDEGIAEITASVATRY